jgi:hypothetical protein
MLTRFLIILLFVHSLSYGFESPLVGEWEGQILSARRPIVLSVNFNNMIARMDVTGSKGIPLKDVGLKGADLTFAIALSDQELKFNGTLIGGQISGIETVNNLRFALERLPESPAQLNRVDRWRQDISAIRSRFLKYDRSYTAEQRKKLT